jgi:hypothetical protein
LPRVPVQHAELQPEARQLAADVREFGVAIQDVLAHVRKVAGSDDELKLIGVLLKSQYLQERLADAACDLYAASCTLSRLDDLLTTGNGHQEHLARDIQAGRYFMTLAHRRIRQNLKALWDNDDEMTTRTADGYLR